MQDVQAGERRALAELYDRFALRAYRTAFAVCHDRDCAEDAVQDAFVSMWSSRATYEPARGSVVGWAMTIVRHRAIYLARRRSAARHSTRGRPRLDDQPARDDVPTRLRRPRRDRAADGAARAPAADAARGDPPRLLRRPHPRGDREPPGPPAGHRQGTHAARLDEAPLRARPLARRPIRADAWSGDRSGASRSCGPSVSGSTLLTAGWPAGRSAARSGSGFAQRRARPRRRAPATATPAAPARRRGSRACGRGWRRRPGWAMSRRSTA